MLDDVRSVFVPYRAKVNVIIMSNETKSFYKNCNLKSAYLLGERKFYLYFAKMKTGYVLEVIIEQSKALCESI